MTQEEKLERRAKRKEEKYNKHHFVIDDLIFKWCKFGDHWVEMNSDNFYKNKSNSIDGFSVSCKIHECEKTQLWIKNNVDQYNQTIKKRDANESKERKIYKRTISKKQRLLGKQKEWANKNKDKTKAYKEKRELKNHKISEREWEYCKKYFNHRCAYCGLAIENHYYTRQGITKLGDFHREHVDDEGANDLSNCVPSCSSCNCQKWKNDFHEWYNFENNVYSKERYDKIIKWINEDYKLYIKIKPTK